MQNQTPAISIYDLITSLRSNQPVSNEHLALAADYLADLDKSVNALVAERDALVEELDRDYNNGKKDLLCENLITEKLVTVGNFNPDAYGTLCELYAQDVIKVISADAETGDYNQQLDYAINEVVSAVEHEYNNSHSEAMVEWFHNTHNGNTISRVFICAEHRLAVILDGGYIEIYRADDAPSYWCALAELARNYANGDNN